jgi:hypothetical protein
VLFTIAVLRKRKKTNERKQREKHVFEKTFTSSSFLFFNFKWHHRSSKEAMQSKNRQGRKRKRKLTLSRAATPLLCYLLIMIAGCIGNYILHHHY